MSPDKKKQRLLQQIAEEERLIRIYEADLKVTRSCKRPRPCSAESLESLIVSDEQDDNWLAALDALQSHDTNVTLDTRWHDYPLLYQMLPHVGGIVFDAAKPVGTTRHEGGARFRSFYFRGYINDATKVEFSMTLEVEFTTSARVSKVDLELSNKEEEELQDIIKVAQETRNMPLLFRQLVSWSKFRRRRNRAIELFQQEHNGQLERVSASLIRVKWSDDSFLGISWRWQVSWATSGKDVLEIQTCRVAREHQPLAAAVTRSKGLQNLIQCVSGDCEKALSIILQAAIVKNSSFINLAYSVVESSHYL
jgi:hypothetical protein